MNSTHTELTFALLTHQADIRACIDRAEAKLGRVPRLTDLDKWSKLYACLATVGVLLQDSSIATND